MTPKKKSKLPIIIVTLLVLAAGLGGGIFAGKIVDTVEEGIKLAEELIDNGKAYKKYEELSNN